MIDARASRRDFLKLAGTVAVLVWSGHASDSVSPSCLPVPDSKPRTRKRSTHYASWPARLKLLTTKSFLELRTTATFLGLCCVLRNGSRSPSKCITTRIRRSSCTGMASRCLPTWTVRRRKVRRTSPRTGCGRFHSVRVQRVSVSITRIIAPAPTLTRDSTAGKWVRCTSNRRANRAAMTRKCFLC
jgi:hypothetical protein